MNAYALGHEVLAHPSRVIDDMQEHPDILARLIAMGVVGSAIFGAVVSTAQPEASVLSHMLRMPVVVVAPLLLCMPTVAWVRRFQGSATPWRDAAHEVVVLTARIGLCLIITIPIIWTWWTYQPNVREARIALAGASTAAVWVACRASADGVWVDEGDAHPSVRMVARGMLILVMASIAWQIGPFLIPGHREFGGWF